MSVRQLDNAKVFKRQGVKVKNALQLAQLENMPQAFFLYKQRNDLLIERLRQQEFKNRTRALLKANSFEDRCVAQMSET